MDDLTLWDHFSTDLKSRIYQPLFPSPICDHIPVNSYKTPGLHTQIPERRRKAREGGRDAGVGGRASSQSSRDGEGGRESSGNLGEIPVAITLVNAATAAAAASWLTNPLDMAKLRLQVRAAWHLGMWARVYKPCWRFSSVKIRKACAHGQETHAFFRCTWQNSRSRPPRKCACR